MPSLSEIPGNERECAGTTRGNRQRQRRLRRSAPSRCAVRIETKLIDLCAGRHRRQRRVEVQADEQLSPTAVGVRRAFVDRGVAIVIARQHYLYTETHLEQRLQPPRQ